MSFSMVNLVSLYLLWKHYRTVNHYSVLNLFLTCFSFLSSFSLCVYKKSSTNLDDKDWDFIMNGRNILWQVEILLWRQVVILLWTVESLRWQVEILLWMVEICMIKFCQILAKFWNAKFGQILDCEGSMSPFNFDEQLPNNVINVSNVFALSIWYITCPFYLCSV